MGESTGCVGNAQAPVVAFASNDLLVVFESFNKLIRIPDAPDEKVAILVEPTN